MIAQQYHQEKAGDVNLFINPFKQCMHVDYDADIEVAVDVDADLRMYGESIHIQLYTGISECICFPYCSKCVFYRTKKIS